MAKQTIDPKKAPILWDTVNEAFQKINDNFTELYLNLSSDSTAVVDLTSLSTDISPSESEVYDLGSPTKKWKDLYLSGSSLFLGNAQVTATGSTVNLPTGSTIGGLLIKDPGDAGFKTITATGQDDVVADTTSDTLNLAGSGITIETDAGTDTVTFINSGVIDITPGTGISSSDSSGTYTITNTGVTSATAGSGISISSSTGAITISNSGVITLTADTGITVTDEGGGTFRLTNTAPNVPQNTFRFIDVIGQSQVEAETTNDTLNLAVGTGIQITTDATNDVVTFTNTGVTTLAVGNGISTTGSTGSVVIANTGVLSIIAGAGIAVDSSTGNVTISNVRPGYTSFAVLGQDPILADNTTDTFTFIAGSGIILTTDDATDSLTIEAVAPTKFAVDDGASTVIEIPDTNSTLKFVAGENIVLEANPVDGEITINSVGVDFFIFVAADDSTQRTIENSQTLQISGGTGISTTSDANGIITITNDVTDTTYGVSAETGSGGAYVRLTGSDATTDDVFLAEGSNIIITRTDANTITFSASITGGGSSNSFTTISVAGESNVVADSSADILTLVEGTGITITTSAISDSITFTNAAPMLSRAAVAGSTIAIADNAIGNVDITGAKGYALFKIQTSHAARVRVYTDSASRTADAARPSGTDPAVGAGVIAEITTSGAETILVSPGTIGYNNEGSPTTTIPIAVTNLSGSVATITVTLTILQLEI